MCSMHYDPAQAFSVSKSGLKKESSGSSDRLEARGEIFKVLLRLRQKAFGTP